MDSPLKTVTFHYRVRRCQNATEKLEKTYCAPTGQNGSFFPLPHFGPRQVWNALENSIGDVTQQQPMLRV